MASQPCHRSRATYLIAYVGGEPLACGALRPLEDAVVDRFGYRIMRLETGHRQVPAMALYASYGFSRIEPFGEHVGDPTSVCYEKTVCSGEYKILL